MAVLVLAPRLILAAYLKAVSTGSGSLYSAEPPSRGRRLSWFGQFPGRPSCRAYSYGGSDQGQSCGLGVFVAFLRPPLQGSLPSV